MDPKQTAIPVALVVMSLVIMSNPRYNLKAFVSSCWTRVCGRIRLLQTVSELLAYQLSK